MKTNPTRPNRASASGAQCSLFAVRLLLLLLLVSGGRARAAVSYVDENSLSPSPPYTNWATAARVIQDAVDAAVAGDEIVVTNGLYATGGRAVGTNLLVNRVAVDKPLSLRSVNGPETTIIQGYQVPGTTNGDGAIRCVYLADGSRLSGFTLIDGATRTNGDLGFEQSGGGLWCESTNAAASHCVITKNSAQYAGGGAYGGYLCDCTLVANSGTGGGGAGMSMLDNCTLTDNAASFGGGAWYSAVTRCRLVWNSASDAGGGGYGGVLNNCILRDNWSRFGGGAANGALNNCTVTGNAASEGGGAYGWFYGTCKLSNSIVYNNTAFEGANYG